MIGLRCSACGNDDLYLIDPRHPRGECEHPDQYYCCRVAIRDMRVVIVEVNRGFERVHPFSEFVAARGGVSAMPERVFRQWKVAKRALRIAKATGGGK